MTEEHLQRLKIDLMSRIQTLEGENLRLMMNLNSGQHFRMGTNSSLPAGGSDDRKSVRASIGVQGGSDNQLLSNERISVSSSQRQQQQRNQQFMFLQHEDAVLTSNQNNFQDILRNLEAKDQEILELKEHIYQLEIQEKQTRKSQEIQVLV